MGFRLSMKLTRSWGSRADRTALHSSHSDNSHCVAQSRFSISPTSNHSVVVTLNFATWTSSMKGVELIWLGAKVEPLCLYSAESLYGSLERMLERRSRKLRTLVFSGCVCEFARSLVVYKW
eukprot:1695815-Amphidinium_carterae.2